ncbi:MAG: metallophosphoesterase [Cytophagaceae bacterium]
MKGNITFFIIVLAVILVLDLYVFSGIRVVSSQWSSGWKKWVYGLYWGYTLLAVLVFFMNYLGQATYWSTGLRTILYGSFMVLTATKLVFAIFLLLDDSQRLIRMLSAMGANLFQQKPVLEGTGISRAEFLVKAGAVLSAVPLVGMTYGIVAGGHDYQVRNIKIKLPKLPKSFEGLKILQLSDIHSGSFFNTTALQRGIDLVNEQKADVVLFTGDIVNYVADELEKYKPMFAQINAPMGVYSVLGNHDYGDYVGWDSIEAKQKNLQQLMQSHADMGWDLLMNEHRILQRGEDKIALLGIENWGAKGNFPKYGKMKEAYKGTEDIPVKVLMSHDPSHWDAEVRKMYPDVDLTLSGHTHGFQFGIEKAGLKWSPVQWMYKQWAGLYQEGKQYLYVNRGFGFIGFPGRVGIRPEITVIELVQG